MNNKQKTLIFFIVLAAVIGIICTMTVSKYNSMVTQQQAVDQAWSEVENQYQRRADLIPNLVNTVKGYTTHENETLLKVTEARAKATSVNISVDSLNEQTLARFQQAQNELSGALKSLLAVTEAYPDLKASENFKDLQIQLEGTENRVATARNRYTRAVQEYNTDIRKFPANIFAGMFGFETKPQFKAEEGAQSAPEVQF